jgi:multisubunit Na+/H+ antiporter MnhE subunit
VNQSTGPTSPAQRRPGANRQETRAREPAARRLRAWLIWWVLLMSFWVAADDSVGFDELLAGAAAAALGATLAELARHQAGLRLRIRPEWLVPALRLPGQVARDTIVVFAALWRRLASGEEPRSGFLAEPVSYGGDSDEDATRRALLVAGRSVAPNTFVLGLDRERDVMIVHRLVTAEPRPAQPGEGAKKGRDAS